MSTTTTGLLSRSREALRLLRQQDDICRIQHDSDQAEKLQRALLRMGIEGGEAQGRFVVVEELTFSLEAHGLIGLHLPCCGCGKPTRHREFVSGLASVSEIVDTVAADRDLFCERCESRAPAPQPTLIEELESVIRRIIREEVGRDE